MNKLFLGFGFCVGLVFCFDFDEVNINFIVVGEEYVKF